MSEKTLGQALAEYINYLKAQGKSERTLYTYGQDAKQIISFFGADRKLTSILTPHIGKFLKSDELRKLPNGNDRAVPTVRKTIRVMRMFFKWAKNMGYIESFPMPKSVPLGRSAQEEDSE